MRQVRERQSKSVQVQRRAPRSNYRQMCGHGKSGQYELNDVARPGGRSRRFGSAYIYHCCYGFIINQVGRCSYAAMSPHDALSNLIDPIMIPEGYRLHARFDGNTQH